MVDHKLQQLAEVIGRTLVEKGHILGFAESCTGGLASAIVTNIPGSSAWFDGGVVVYSNQAKQDLLQVSKNTLHQYGAVSEQVAAEMAEGLIKQGRASIVASVTGIAGPDGGTTEKPVGTVCFAWASKDHSTKTCQLLLSGNRQEIRQKSVSAMLTGLKDFL
jgi:nicotinamide-nucleotide amidase